MQWLADRLACAFLGAIFGTAYGLLLAIGVGFVTDGHFRAEFLWGTIAAFAALGIALGPVVGDVIGSLLHFVVGVFAGVLSGWAGAAVDPQPRATGLLRALFVLGAGTGLAVYLAWNYF